MESTLAWLVGGAAAVTALGVLWQKLVRPLLGLIAKLVHLVDLLDQLAPYLERLPDSLPVIVGIAEDFPDDQQPLLAQLRSLAQQVSALQDTVEDMRERMGQIEHHQEQQRMRWAAGQEDE